MIFIFNINNIFIVLLIKINSLNLSNFNTNKIDYTILFIIFFKSI